MLQARRPQLVGVAVREQRVGAKKNFFDANWVRSPFSDSSNMTEAGFLAAHVP